MLLPRHLVVVSSVLGAECLRLAALAHSSPQLAAWHACESSGLAPGFVRGVSYNALVRHSRQPGRPAAGLLVLVLRQAKIIPERPITRMP